MCILITGGAGFIGSNFINEWLELYNEPIINIDKLTYSGNENNFKVKPNDTNHILFQGDISDFKLVSNLLNKFNPRAIINFAAESHVDNSITNPINFINTNIIGTFNLLECSKNYWKSLSLKKRENFRFLHISTDEVYGSLKKNDFPFTEESPFKPNSPYSASKASSDHLVRSYYKTYGLPTLTTNSSNNYGPYQYPEKLIPLIINNALSKKKLPIYGDGKQIRDWIYVSDHCSAIRSVLFKGKIGETYNIGGNNEKTNLEIVRIVCDLLDKIKPLKSKSENLSYKSLIKFVRDRPGHDQRYAINNNKIQSKLGWTPTESFEDGLARTVNWYIDNLNWVKNLKSV